MPILNFTIAASVETHRFFCISVHVLIFLSRSAIFEHVIAYILSSLFGIYDYVFKLFNCFSSLSYLQYVKIIKFVEQLGDLLMNTIKVYNFIKFMKSIVAGFSSMIYIIYRLFIVTVDKISQKNTLRLLVSNT